MASTPLSRYGSRVPAAPPSTATKVTTPRVTTTPQVSSTPMVASPAISPSATIRTVIVCVPDELPRESLTAYQLGRHLDVQGTLSAQFWPIPHLRPWHRSRMFGLRKGRPAYCAGGPVRLLNLVGMRHAAGLAAGIRYQVWARVVHGTRAATPWPTFHSRHLANPARYPLEAAHADFTNQPRVNAMRMHNAVTDGKGQLDTDELEMFQAGCTAYQHYRAASAVAADALHTAEGAKLVPESDLFAHRVTYLHRATRYLDTIEDTQRLLAITL
jgi:hypothetical protein